MKRAFDFVFASLGLVALAPLMLVLAALVRINIGSPVLFRQERPGLKGQPFELVKFRTMRIGDEADAVRLTRFGRALRASSLDELPELWNVIKGDMSLVGPRPLLKEYMPLYNAHQMRRHDVRPGITGWAQVNGRNAMDWPSKFDYDLWYVDNHSLWLDCRILLRTVWMVVRREGVRSRDHATTERFRGNE